MGLETGVVYIEDLVKTNPISTDTIDEGQNHLNIIKTAVQGSFPSLGAAAVTRTAADINGLISQTGTETLENKTLDTPVIENGIVDAIVNVKWFGAVGDGLTDDSVVIQNAIDSLTTGGVVFFPAGTYLISTGLTYTQTGTTEVNPGITLIGEGRRTSTIKYTGTTGFAFSATGATGMAIASTGRFGLIEGIKVTQLGFIGTGRTSGNADSGIYVQGYNHFILDDCLISDFAQDGIFLDRLYYQLTPDATLDDRGSFAHLRDSEISLCYRIGLQAGGLANAFDYSADHLRTDNLHITTCGSTAAHVYCNNWTDTGSLFYGDAIGIHLYSQNSSILTQNVTMVGSRIEGGQSDCMLKIDSCLSGQFINMFFPGHGGPLPTSQVKVATDASFNVGYLTFEQCIHQTATTAYDIVGAGGVTGVKIVNPRFAGVMTNEVTNTASKPVQLIKGNTYERITGSGAPIALDGVGGNLFTATLSGDSQPWYRMESSGRRLYLGNGTGTADISITLSSWSPEGVVTANPGSIHFNTVGGAGTSFYVKESGTGNTGWVGK